MGLPRTCLPRADETLEVLRRVKASHLDPCAVEELFPASAPAAINLMNEVGLTGDRKTDFQVTDAAREHTQK
jgi:hypothetical protein